MTAFLTWQCTAMMLVVAACCCLMCSHPDGACFYMWGIPAPACILCSHWRSCSCFLFKKKYKSELRSIYISTFRDLWSSSSGRFLLALIFIRSAPAWCWYLHSFTMFIHACARSCVLCAHNIRNVRQLICRVCIVRLVRLWCTCSACVACVWYTDIFICVLVQNKYI